MKFSLVIKSNNDGMVNDGLTEGSIRDINGQPVGSWKLS